LSIAISKNPSDFKKGTLHLDVKIERQNKEANINSKKDEDFRDRTHSWGRSPRSHHGEAFMKEDHIKIIWSHSRN
jgi:hypothetical protein